MLITSVPRLFIFLMSVAVTSAFAQLPSDNGSPQSEKTVFLSPNYDFGKPNLGRKGGPDSVSIIWADTLQLLNKSTWNADHDEPIPVSIDTALSLAINTLGKSGVAVKKTQLLDCSLQHLFFDAAENVWYYDIVFDAAAGTPALDGKREMTLHRVIVLMDGTAVAQDIHTLDQIRNNFNQLCAYTKSQGKWTQTRCVSRASNAKPASNLGPTTAHP